MKQKMKISGPMVSVLLVAVLGGWHFLETKRGTLVSRDFWLCDWYIGLFAAAMVFLVVFGLVFLKTGTKSASLARLANWNRVRVEVCAGLAVFFLGTMYMVVLPPLSAPDEIAHFCSAYAISNQMLGMERTDEYGFVLMRKEDEFLQNVEVVEGDVGRTSLGRVLTEETAVIIPTVRQCFIRPDLSHFG